MILNPLHGIDNMNFLSRDGGWYFGTEEYYTQNTKPIMADNITLIRFETKCGCYCWWARGPVSLCKACTWHIGGSLYTLLWKFGLYHSKYDRYMLLNANLGACADGIWTQSHLYELRHTYMTKSIAITKYRFNISSYSSKYSIWVAKCSMPSFRDSLKGQAW